MEGNTSEEVHLLQESSYEERSCRYASVQYLSRYIPELDPKNERAKTVRVKMAKRSVMLGIQTTLAILVVAINITVTIYAIVQYPPDSRGVGTFFQGSCSSVTVLNSALHVGVNVVSSLFLGAGNYCMQILVAPSREETDNAHRKGRALEIGVPSMINLWYIERKRAVAWFITGLTTIVLHIFWNSSVFTSLPMVSIPRAVATSDFQIAGDNWTTSDPLPKYPWWHFAQGYGEASRNLSWIYSLQAAAPDFTRLDKRTCIQRYIDPMTATSSVIVVAQNVTSVQNNGSSLLDGWQSEWESWDMSTFWICSAYGGPPWDRKFCNWDLMEQYADNWTLSWPSGIQVDYCLAGVQGNNQDRRGFHYSMHICGVVCLFTCLECLLICWTLWYHSRQAPSKELKRNKRTIVTMGDAIQSFLQNPHLEGPTMENPLPKASSSERVEVRVARWWAEPSIPWLRAVSTRIWFTSLLFFLAVLTILLYYVASTLQWLMRRGIDVSPAAIWQLGFKVQPAAIANDFQPFIKTINNHTTTGLLLNIIIANSPQVMVSFLYLFFNNILTRQLVSDEWVRFLRKDGKKPLRVSSPEGMQRSTYFLSLPLKYSVPLTALSILLHWLISQSLFLVQACAFTPGRDSVRLPVYDWAARGFSMLGSILSIGLGIALVLGLILNSLVRHYKNIPAGFQLMAFKSNAIAAMCQRPGADSDARLFPISIGAIADPDSLVNACYQRIAFSTDTGLCEPQNGVEYLRPLMIREAGMWDEIMTRGWHLTGGIHVALCSTWKRLRRRTENERDFRMDRVD